MSPCPADEVSRRRERDRRARGPAPGRVFVSPLGTRRAASTNELVQRITKSFYSRRTDTRGGDAVNLQGLSSRYERRGPDSDRPIPAGDGCPSRRPGPVQCLGSPRSRHVVLTNENTCPDSTVLTRWRRSPLIDLLREQNAPGEGRSPAVEFVRLLAGRVYAAPDRRPAHAARVVSGSPPSRRRSGDPRSTAAAGRSRRGVHPDPDPSDGLAEANAGVHWQARRRRSDSRFLSWEPAPPTCRRTWHEVEAQPREAVRPPAERADRRGRRGPVDRAASICGRSPAHGLEPEVLATWFRYLGIGGDATLKLDHLTN